MLNRRTFAIGASAALLTACASTVKQANYDKKIAKLALVNTPISLTGYSARKMMEANIGSFDSILFDSVRAVAPAGLVLEASEAQQASHELRASPTNFLDAGGNVTVYFQVSLIDVATKQMVWEYRDSVTVGPKFLVLGPFDKAKADKIATEVFARLRESGLLAS